MTLKYGHYRFEVLALYFEIISSTTAIELDRDAMETKVRSIYLPMQRGVGKSPYTSVAGMAHKL